MSVGFFNIPAAVNEPIKQYAPGSAERETLQAKLKEMRSIEMDAPMYIGNQEVRTNKKVAMRPPHDHQHILGYYHQGDKSHVQQAIDAD